MGKPVKLTDQKKSWFQRRSRLTRQYRTRPQRERYLIVCEGEKTEPNYFESLKAVLPRNLVDIDIKGVGANTMYLVERATQLLNSASTGDFPYQHVWVIFDRDSFPADQFDNAINAATARGLHTGWSNEAFELWYLLHFEDRFTAMSRSEFAGKLSSHLGKPYEKNSVEMYDLLQSSGSEKEAMRRAAQLHDFHNGTPPSQSNPCTYVNELVQRLNEYRVLT